MLSSIYSDKATRTFFLLIMGVLFSLTLIASLYLIDLQNVRAIFMRTGTRLVLPLVFLPLAGVIAVKLPLFEHRLNLLFHFLLSLVFVAFYIVTLPLVMHAFRGENLFVMGEDYIFSLLIGQFLLTGSTGFILYWLVVVLAGLQAYYKEMNKIKSISDELESQLMQANLSALKAQLKPHFLFNTLNMTDYLISTDPIRAREIIKKLESLLKNTFERDQQDTRTLSAEVANIHKYLEIEKTRFEDRLRVDINIADETKDLLIPTFILQPLVENSIKYGLNKTVETCTITISSFIEQDYAVIEVTDNAKKTSQIPSKEKWGVGLKNTKKRLKLFFGEKAKLNLDFITEECFRTQILIPINDADK